MLKARAVEVALRLALRRWASHLDAPVALQRGLVSAGVERPVLGEPGGDQAIGRDPVALRNFITEMVLCRFHRCCFRRARPQESLPSRAPRRARRRSQLARSPPACGWDRSWADHIMRRSATKARRCYAAPMVRRDEIEWVRENLAEAVGILAGRGDLKMRLANARGRVIWMIREYMPTRGATAALGTVKDALCRLDDEAPAKAADLAPLRKAIAELIGLIDRHLRVGRQDR